MSIFSKIEQVAKGVAHTAQGLLVKIFGQSAVDNFDQEVASLFKEDVISIISDAVTAAESLQLDGGAATGDQKRAAAFSQIASDLKSKGVSLASNVINLGIELVVGFLKAKTPAATAPTAASAPPAASA